MRLEVHNNHGVGDCPFCGREGKFSADVTTGLWRCFVCSAGSVNGGGNGLTFIRLLHARCVESTVQCTLDTIASDRKLLSGETVKRWGVCVDVAGTWLVPGYGPDGKLDQLYRRTSLKESSGEWVQRLLPTPGLWPEGKVHALHMPAAHVDSKSREVVVCEGPWDGMALDEVVCPDPAGLSSVVAVPGCNVWRDEWTEMCRGRKVTLLFDSDHPRQAVPGSQHVSRAGYDGMVRMAKKLSGVASAVRWLRWGPEGYNTEKPSGWDIRDELGAAGAREDRAEILTSLFEQVEDAPREWFNPASQLSPKGDPHHRDSVEALPCCTWRECEAAWKEALHWRVDLSQATAVLLAICASTNQAGNQLFLDLIGSPGSAKTTIARGLLVSGHCIHLENITKLISGYKKAGEEDTDCSFLARANNKTWVTCEFDVLGSSPQYRDLMGKIRRIFDGETSATYGNSDKDIIYTALRTPWVRAGTPRMMDRMADYDQSQLGDRFMRFIISDPAQEEKRSIIRSALRSERAALVEQANCMAGSTVDPKTRRAHALTGGYVDWLRANVEQLITKVDVPEYAEEFCIDLAELCADLRARPTEDKRKLEVHDSKELPTRLARQNVRLATCLAVVMNKLLVDSEVLGIVRKVALDTAYGHSQTMAYWLCSQNPKAGDGRTYQECGGLMLGTLEAWTHMPRERLQNYLSFLCKIGVLEMRDIKHAGNAWLLTERSLDLYLRVMKG